MLPSTGYFKEINCPFYDSGLCERPYCHFRHVKKDPQSISGEGIENGDILHQIVSEAVKKVLQQTESAGPTADVSNSTIISQVIQKATYNPTPIAELKKITSTDTENNDENNEQRRKHIPVPYTPRKPPSLPIKRPEENGECTPYIYVPPPAQYLPGSTDTTTLDQYTPEGAVQSKETYLPGTEAKLQEYKPDETKASNLNYVPSDKTVHKKKLLEYKPVVVSSNKDKPKVVYQPTPKSQTPCFSDDEEPAVKKPKLSSDLCGLDDLGAEFDMLGEILDEEKNEQKCKENIAKTSEKSKVHNDSGIKSHNKQEKSEVKKSKSKNEDVDKHKSDKDKERKDSKKDKAHERKHETNKSDKSVTHKSSSRDKDKRKSTDKNKDKSKEEDKDRHKKSRDKEKSRDHKKEHAVKDSTDTKKSKSESERSSSKKSDKHNSKSDHKDKSSHRTSKDSSRDKKKEKHKSEKTHNVSEIEEHVADDIMNIEDETLDMSESDEDAIALECKRIFEEYVPTAKSQSTEEDLPTESEIEEYIPTKKRISHTIDKNIKIVPKAPLKPDFKVGAAQQMADRLAKVREYHNKIQLTVEKPETPKNVPNHTKVRIAHVPYASSLLNAKKVRPAAQVIPNAPCTSTAVQTVQKGTKRVAHMPNEKFIDRPGVLEPLGSRIPANIRSTYLNMMIDESLKIYISAVDAYARAQHEELNTNKKCKTIQIYKNSALLTVSRLRKECQECNGVKKSGLDCTALQKVTGAVTGNSGNAGTWSIENKNKRAYDNPYEYKGPRLYENIKKWILTEEQLQENGFPRPHPNGEKGRATIKSENRTKPPKGIFRTCCRCSKEYTVDKKGFANVKEECVYHPNRKYKFRGEVKYQCCSQDGMSDGCCVAPCHVYDYVDYENLRGYVKTLPPEREMDDYGVYSLDCEMCYTTHGLDLTRITVIDSACKVVYETLIKPLHAIIDYNTRYSGITEEQMVDVRTTLLDVQAALLTMFSSKTILIGHSLESDFKALKLMHDTVIDTSVLFPHKMGPPYKRALRNLSSEHLKKIIQNSVEGHNSAEDATVCMELIHYKLKEDLKTR